MDKWYTIGNGSPFDGDMNISELCINYHVRGNSDDIDAFYHHYMASIYVYWDQFELTFNEATEEDFLKYYLKSERKTGDLYNDDNDPRTYYDYLVSYRIDNKLEDLKQKLNQYIDIIKKEYASKNIDRNALRISIMNAFLYLSDILCFGYDYPKGTYNNKLLSDYVLDNQTGFFSFNSYMFAFINKVVLIGFPVTFSYFDQLAGCPGYFTDHDLDHSKNIEHKISDEGLNIIKIVYKEIMLDDYTKNEKEALIFIFWFKVHETENYQTIVELDPDFFDKLFDNFGTYVVADYIGIFSSISRQTLDNIKKNYNDIFHREIRDYLRVIEGRIDQYIRAISRKKGLEPLPKNFKQALEDYIMKDIVYSNIDSKFGKYSDSITMYINTAYGIYLYNNIINSQKIKLILEKFYDHKSSSYDLND
tara:strand:- start:69 stop:1325 length:1257 start_codon:yes stop_codon:yes gene_type:complete